MQHLLLVGSVRQHGRRSVPPAQAQVMPWGGLATAHPTVLYHRCRRGDALTKDTPAGPLVVVLVSAPHPVFSRRGASDLKAKLKLPLLNALTGGCVRLDTLDGR